MWSSISVFCSRQTRTSGGEHVRRSCCLHVYLLPPSGQKLNLSSCFELHFLSFHLERNQIFTIGGLEQEYKSKQAVVPFFWVLVSCFCEYLSTSSAQLTCAVLHSHLQDSKSNHIYWELIPVTDYYNTQRVLNQSVVQQEVLSISFHLIYTSHLPTPSCCPTFYWGLSSSQRQQAG